MSEKFRGMVVNLKVIYAGFRDNAVDQVPPPHPPPFPYKYPHFCAYWLARYFQSAISQHDCYKALCPRGQAGKLFRYSALLL